MSLTSCPWPMLPLWTWATQHHLQGPQSPSTLAALPSTAIGPSSCLRFQAVNIGIGTFAVVPADSTSADGKAVVVQKPVFKPCRFMKTFYKLRCAGNEISSKKLFALLSLCSPCLLLHAVVPVPWQSKVSCNMERPSVGAHTASQNLPLPWESAPSLRLVPPSSWMLVASGKASLGLLFPICSALEMWPKLARAFPAPQRCARAGRCPHLVCESAELRGD